MKKEINLKNLNKILIKRIQIMKILAIFSYKHFLDQKLNNKNSD